MREEAYGGNAWSMRGWRELSVGKVRGGLAYNYRAVLAYQVAALCRSYCCWGRCLSRVRTFAHRAGSSSFYVIYVRQQSRALCRALGSMSLWFVCASIDATCLWTKQYAYGVRSLAPR